MKGRWENKFKLLDPEPIADELWALRPGQYDNFIGYMCGLIASGDVAN